MGDESAMGGKLTFGPA